MLAEFGKRVREERDRKGWSLHDLGGRVGRSATWVKRVESGEFDIGFTSLFKLAEVFEADPLWLATGRGTREAKVATPKEISLRQKALLDAFEALPEDGKALFGGLIEWVADDKPIDELAAHREQRMRSLPVIARAAARSDESSVAFEEQELDEAEVPEELWAEGRKLVRVEGESMAECGIHTGALLVVEELAQLGSYHPGDIVIAETDVGGIVVKRYGGQGRAARPPLETGWIRLESCGAGQEIVRPRAEEGTPGILIRFKVVDWWPR